MAGENALKALRKPGRIAFQGAGQTFDFSTAYPHGGTAIGLKKGVVLRRLEGRELNRFEEFSTSVEIAGSQFLGEQYILVFALRGEDDDAMGALFPNTSTGTPSGRTGLVYPGTTTYAGQMNSGRTVPVVFSPDDAANHLAVYFPQAEPLVALELEVAFGRAPAQEAEWAVGFAATRDAATSGRAAQVLLLEDLTV